MSGSLDRHIWLHCPCIDEDTSVRYSVVISYYNDNCSNDDDDDGVLERPFSCEC